MSTLSMAYSPTQDKFVKAPVDPLSELVDVDEAYATAWLARNTTNRKRREQFIQKYAADMLAGKFMVTGEAIKFATDGTLLDGQNRLIAICRTKATIRTFVVWNLDRASQSVMDSGCIRTVAHDLQIAGQKDSNVVASVAKRVLLFESGIYGPSSPTAVTSKSMIHSFLAAHTELPALARLGGDIARNLRVAPSMMGTAAVILHWISREDAADFFAALQSGEGLVAGSPILVLREKMRRLRELGIKGDSEKALGYVMAAWNAHVEGRRIVKLQYDPASQAFPLPRGYMPGSQFSLSSAKRTA